MELKDAKGLKVYLKFFHLRSYPQVSKSISLWLVMGRWEVSADFTKESVWQSELLPVQENYFTYLKLNSHSASTKETHMFLISPRISSPYSHCFYFKTVFFCVWTCWNMKIVPNPQNNQHQFHTTKVRSFIFRKSSAFARRLPCMKMRGVIRSHGDAREVEVEPWWLDIQFASLKLRVHWK